jgi:hypothetical protein
VGKPIASFVREIDLDPAVVDLVHSCFVAGEVCEVALPFRAPDGRELRIALRVEPLRDSSGEVSDFIAIASDASNPVESTSPVRACVDLGKAARALCHEIRPKLGARSQLEVEVELDLPLAVGDEDQLWDLAQQLGSRVLADLRDDWGTITVGAGLLGCEPGPLYRSDALSCLPGGRYAYLEVHDTGPELAPHLHRRSQELFKGGPDDMDLERADRLLRAHGGRVFAESAPWCGTSVLLVLPLALGHTTVE